jgi:hypothetical protein
MERYGRPINEGTQSDPSQEWTATGPEAGHHGKLRDSAFSIPLSFCSESHHAFGDCDSPN